MRLAASGLTLTTAAIVEADVCLASRPTIRRVGD
jgi:hypothetical protein